MQEIKIATFNAEWMIAIFGGLWKDWDGTIPNSFKGKSLGDIKLPRIDDVPGLCGRISGVIEEMNPDIIGIVEGPPRKDQMELFVQQYLNGEYIVYESNERNQSIFILVRKSLSSLVSQIPHDSTDLALLNSQFYYYPWVRFRQEDRKKHKFDRIPLVLNLNISGNRKLQFVAIHTKSKFSKLKTLEQWETRDEEAVLDALDARQKLSAEVGQIRLYLDQQLAQENDNKGLVVMGDFNDSPFAELMEKEFLLHNILDELVGSFLRPEYLMHHAMTPSVLSSAKTVRFSDPLEGGAITEELIDHILVSPSIAGAKGAFKLKPDSCKVETAAYNKYNDDINDNDRGLRPSDHKPVSAMLTW
jgi:endonuclease/exonuclease/phosphatase family metal-dependent hydrolase